MRKVLIFDFDGVIVDSLDFVMKIHKKVFNKYNLKPINSKKEFVNLYDENFYDSLRKLGIPENIIAKFLKELKLSYVKNKDNFKFFNNIKEVLKRLSNHKIIIISSNITYTIEEFLKSEGIDFIDEIIGADKETSKIKKILYIKKKYPDFDIYYFGDTKGDIIEGKKAKVKTVAVTWGYHSKDKLKEENPDYIIDKPKELLNLFKNN